MAQQDSKKDLELTKSSNSTTVLSNLKDNKGKLFSGNGEDLLTIECSGSDKLILYYIKKEKDPVWKIGKFVIFTGSSEEQNRLKTEIQYVIDSNWPGKKLKHLQLYVNPMSGWKKAKSMVKKDVLPVFELLNIKVTILETERKGHLKEHVQTLNVDDFDGIIVAGGDGSFAELINGLLEKGMKDANLDLNTPGIRPPSPNVTLGILPCGTGNGLANSSHGCLDPVTAALHIVKGISIPSKAFTVHSGSKFMRYGFLCGGYGVFSLAIKRSETNRWMGPLRYVYGMFSSMAQNKDFMVTTSAEVYTTDNRIDGPTEWKEFPKTVRNVEIFIYDMREGWGNTTKQGLQNALFVCLVLPCKVWEQFKGVYKLITRNPTRFDKDCYLPFNCRSLKMEWDDDAIGYDGYINVDGEITNLPERNCCLTAFGDAFRVFGRSEKVQDEKH